MLLRFGLGIKEENSSLRQRGQLHCAAIPVHRIKQYAIQSNLSSKFNLQNSLPFIVLKSYIFMRVPKYILVGEKCNFMCVYI